jgi:hypothetical protein
MQLYLQPADCVDVAQPAGDQQDSQQELHPPSHVPPSVGPLHAPNIVTTHNNHCTYTSRLLAILQGKFCKSLVDL